MLFSLHCLSVLLRKQMAFKNLDLMEKALTGKCLEVKGSQMHLYKSCLYFYLYE